MAQLIKKALSGLIEKMFEPVPILAIRQWTSPMIFEIDIQYPRSKMEKWTSIRRFKCKVGMLEYRDYTPARWNMRENVCTLIIEAGHTGSGSKWLNKLKCGDHILLGEAQAAHIPAKEGKILGLGDGSAIGHFLALNQLASHQNNLDVRIYIDTTFPLSRQFEDAYPDLHFLRGDRTDRSECLVEYCKTTDLSSYSFIYLAGNIPMVKKMRNFLKEKVEAHVKIYAHGFWS